MSVHVCSFVPHVCLNVWWENIHLLILETPSQVLLRMKKRFLIIPVFIKLLRVFRNPNLMKLISAQQTKQTENPQHRKYKASTVFNKYNCSSFRWPFSTYSSKSVGSGIMPKMVERIKWNVRRKKVRQNIQNIWIHTNLKHACVGKG